jgi:hypothetical protein
MFLGRMATLQAIHRNETIVFNPDRKGTHWGKRKLKRTGEIAFGRSFCLHVLRAGLR